MDMERREEKIKEQRKEDRMEKGAGRKGQVYSFQS